ncbi:hypothetical protein V8E54_007584, partial [Elaphomyces granulatus]
RAHIGYLVGYDSTNVFRVWVPHLKRVFRTRDIRIDETRQYDPKEPHLAEELREEVEDIIRTIEVPEPAYGSTHLLTPAETPEPMAEHVDAEQPDLSTIEPHSGEQLQLDSLMDTHGINEQALEDEAGINTGQSESQHSSAPVTTVSADLLPEHIIEGKRIRKPTDRKAVCHATASTHTFSAYLTAFNVKSGLNKRIHRSDLPPPPKLWKEMLNHPFSQYFTIACGMEYTKIEERETFEIVDMPYG